ncbi:MAG: hypothetical protein WC671_02325 [Candidatus Paceibacterota bacterium]|jgi:hypothetical protein
MKNNKKMSVGKKVAVGAGAVVVASAVGAGVYYLFGPRAKAHQKKAISFISKMKKDVEKEVRKTKEVTIPIYNNIVDTVSSNYAKQYKIYEGDVKVLAKKLKSEWKGVNKVAKKTVKTLKKKSL